MLKRKPIIHIVQRKDFPVGTKGDKNLEGYQRGDHVYVLKGRKNTQAIKHHEIYHHQHHHVPRPKNPRTFIRQELEADMYAREKTGLHNHVKGQLRGVGNQVNEIYKTPMSRVVRMMSTELRKKDIPRTWKKDWNHIVKKDAYRGRTPPKGLIIKQGL
jgi:hypothetical protein